MSEVISEQPKGNNQADELQASSSHSDDGSKLDKQEDKSKFKGSPYFGTIGGDDDDCCCCCCSCPIMVIVACILVSSLHLIIAHQM